MHAVLLLPVADAGAAAEVVQERRRTAARAVRVNRGKLLAEMGTVIPDDVEIRVWDSSAEARYLVLPMRPDGHRRACRRSELAGIVTRLDDRCAAAVTGTPFDDESLPRDNGELVFDAPWQARALAIAVAVVEKLDLPWDTRSGGA